MLEGTYLELVRTPLQQPVMLLLIFSFIGLTSTASLPQKGQLGHKDLQTRGTPTLVKDLAGIDVITGEAFQSLLVDDAWR